MDIIRDYTKPIMHNKTVTFGQPELVTNGTYFTRILYNNNPLYQAIVMLCIPLTVNRLMLILYMLLPKQRILIERIFRGYYINLKK